MNPVDQRVTELVDKWVTSIELHLKYATLTDEAYWQAQPWPHHQRPARWILELAQTRAQELKHQLAARIAGGDAGFAEALDLVAFLANLVGVVCGSRAIERLPAGFAVCHAAVPDVDGGTIQDRFDSRSLLWRSEH